MSSLLPTQGTKILKSTSSMAKSSQIKLRYLFEVLLLVKFDFTVKIVCLTCNLLQTFGEEFLSDKLKPFFKSDPIPEKVNLSLSYHSFSSLIRLLSSSNIGLNFGGYRTMEM